MSFASASIAWIKANPSLFVFYFWIIGSVVTGLMRKWMPGTRWVAIVSGIFVDLVKVFCAVFKIPLPGGFSPAPAVIPATEDAVKKMPDPTPSERPGPKGPGIGTKLSGLVLWSLAALSMTTGGCAWFQAHPAVEHNIAGLLACAADAADAGLDADQIVAECDGLALNDVIQILATKKKIEAKALARHEGAPSPSSSSSSCPLPVKP